MKKSNALLVMLIAIFSTIGIVSIAYPLITTVDVKDIGMDLSVGDRIGINVDSDKLWFGMVRQGGSAKREIIVSNSHDFPVIMAFLPLGELNGYASLSDNNFALEPNKTRMIGISVSAPLDMPYGNYTGTLRVTAKRACVFSC